MEAEITDDSAIGHDIHALRQQAGIITAKYLNSRSKELPRLSEFRQIGWNSPTGDDFFAKQRQNADEANEKAQLGFYKLMKQIGRELHSRTKVFSIQSHSQQGVRILDMCMAPGGFLATALDTIAESTALAFSLPTCNGGHRVRLPKCMRERVEKRFLDITMLAEDMRAPEIPVDHADAQNFLPRQLSSEMLFDLVFCDGQVLRTHTRAPYREKREATRLTVTQLALGLEHLREGGSMIILLHKLDSYETLCLVQLFRGFSKVQLVKPECGHAKRSSFYMIAVDVQSRNPVALQAIESWKSTWKITTFDSVERYLELIRRRLSDAETFLNEYGPELVQMGESVWKTQADALAKSPFVKEHLLSI